MPAPKRQIQLVSLGDIEITIGAEKWSALASLCRRERGVRDGEKETVRKLWRKLDRDSPNSPRDFIRFFFLPWYGVCCGAILSSGLSLTRNCAACYKAQHRYSNLTLAPSRTWSGPWRRTCGEGSHRVDACCRQGLPDEQPGQSHAARQDHLEVVQFLAQEQGAEDVKSMSLVAVAEDSAVARGADDVAPMSRVGSEATGAAVAEDSTKRDSLPRGGLRSKDVEHLKKFAVLGVENEPQAQLQTACQVFCHGVTGNGWSTACVKLVSSHIWRICAFSYGLLVFLSTF